MLNSKPNTRLVAGRHARSSMTTIVLQSKAIEHTFGAERNIHEAGKQACCLTTFSKKSQCAATTKGEIMFRLCKHLHLVHALIAKINGDAMCAQSHVHPLISHWHVSSANSNFVRKNKSATKAALNPKSWVVQRHGHNPSDHERTRLNSGRSKGAIQARQGPNSVQKA